MTFLKETSTVERPHSQPPTVQIPRFSFEIISAGERGKRLVFAPKNLRRAHVGRSQRCELKLSDPSVSLRHAALELVDGRLCITDLDSLNGTFVEGVRIRSAFLSGGELVRFADTQVRLDVELPEAPTALPDVARFGRVVGKSPEMRALYVACEALALSDDPVLIEGETGTGKELLAEAIHEVGPRASEPFVVFDCAATAPERAAGLLGASATDGASLLAEVGGGTLVIDDIGELDLATQKKLLGLLASAAAADARFIATTKRDLDREVEAGRFLPELLDRFAAHRLDVPPLRSRQGDVAVLAPYFWEAMGGAGAPPPDFAHKSHGYAWPGNVQELMNAVARRLTTGAEALPEPAAVGESPDVIADVIRHELSFSHARRRVLDAFEGRYLKWILAKHGGNISRAAAAAGIARRYFYAVRSRTEA